MATMTVLISESVTLNSTSQNCSYSAEIEGVENLFKRIVNIPAGNDVTVVRFSSAVNINDAAIDIDTVKYLRITNLDGTHPVTLHLHIDAGEDDSGADESCGIVLPAEKSFILGGVHDAIGVYDTDASIITNLHDLESIFVDSGANTVQLEILIASSV